MKRVRIVSLLLITVFFAECQSIDVEQKIKEDYKKSINYFKSSLCNHFPTELPDSSSYTATVPKQDTLKMLGFGVDKIMLWKHYNSSKYSELSSHYDSLSKAIYSPNDSNLLLVFSYSDVVEIDGRTYKNQESPERQKLAKHNSTSATSLPVPLFEVKKYSSNTMCGLDKDFKLYILDAQVGKYLDEKYLQECDCIPKEWKHGYSKGVAMSDKKRVIIYWIIVW